MGWPNIEGKFDNIAPDLEGLLPKVVGKSLAPQKLRPKTSYFKSLVERLSNLPPIQPREIRSDEQTKQIVNNKEYVLPYEQPEDRFDLFKNLHRIPKRGSVNKSIQHSNHRGTRRNSSRHLFDSDRADLLYMPNSFSMSNNYNHKSGLIKTYQCCGTDGEEEIVSERRIQSVPYIITHYSLTFIKKSIFTMRRLIFLSNVEKTFAMFLSCHQNIANALFATLSTTRHVETYESYRRLIVFLIM